MTIKTNYPIVLSIPLLCSVMWGCVADTTPNFQQSNSTAVTADLAKITKPQLNGPLKIASELPHYLNRDIQDEVFYFVMPDRFANGNSDNDLGSKTQVVSAGGFDRTKKGMYHGGDLQGLEKKLPYLEKLGITAIWLTPILRNQAMQAETAGYHGYWVLDFTQIDPHLGSNDDLKSLISAAHEKNIKIFFDIITNHTADVIKYTDCHGEDGMQWLMQGNEDCPFKSVEQLQAGDTYQPVIPSGQENLKTPAWLNDPAYYHNQGDTNWVGESSLRGDFAGLDDLNTNDPRVVSGMIDIFKNLISEFKPDGFRIDTVKHVNTEFWAAFSPALISHAKAQGIEQFFMFGEVADDKVNTLSEYTTKGKIQSVLDFGFQRALSDTLIRQQGTDKLSELFAQDYRYLDDDSNANQLLNFTGNHDMGRFTHLLAKSDLQYSESEIVQRTLLAHAMMYFARGVPIVYYGDEQGFVGDGHDQDSRQDMMPSLVASYNDDDLVASNATTADDNFDTQHPFYRLFSEYAHVYHQHSVLRHGLQQILHSETKPGIFALSRTLAHDGSEAIVVFNTATTKEKVVLKAAAPSYKVVYQGASKQDESTLSQHTYAINNQELTVTVPGLSFAIYIAK